MYYVNLPAQICDFDGECAATNYSTVFYDEKNNVTSLSQLKANAGNGYVIAKKSV